MAAILLILVVVLFAWGLNLTKSLKKLNAKLKPITDSEAYAKTTRKLADSDLSKARQEAKAILDGVSTRKQELEQTIEQLTAQSRQAEAKLMMVNEGLKLRSDEAFLLEVGYYEPVYGFEDLSRYEKELRRIKDNQKQLLRTSGEGGDRSGAAFATSPLTYNGSEAQGRQLLKRILRLMLRAFNGECDSFIARVNYRNIEAMKKRITSSYQQINQLAETWHCSISDAYLTNRILELELVYEYEEAKQKEKGRRPLQWCNSPGTPTPATPGWAAQLNGPAQWLALQGRARRWTGTTIFIIRGNSLQEHLRWSLRLDRAVCPPLPRPCAAVASAGFAASAGSPPPGHAVRPSSGRPAASRAARSNPGTSRSYSQYCSIRGAMSS